MVGVKIHCTCKKLFYGRSQDSSDTEISDDEQSTVQEPEKVDQSGRVNLLAALFKKTFSEVKTKAKAVSSKEDG
ncbi:hypothetical protein IGI04_034477 [Brassica rapa subsp. trilocularis]|uniref:Uncharacterized protein n=1 Tax=Brassica rapa subsp. trilocularis TaxID=1813537 RepID=A0ABQ7L9T8_BRACM|nr:hypothetical protein IGI04_034477 [Brassica rapa subsp. trilocularis]